MVAADRFQQQMDQWLRDLINFTRKNPLLYYKSGSKSACEITSPELQDALKILFSAGRGGVELYTPPELRQKPGSVVPPNVRQIVTTIETRERFSKLVPGLKKRSETEFMEKGLWTLYLGVGILEWETFEGISAQPGQGEIVRSPVVMLPVSIIQTARNDAYCIKFAEEDAATNPALSAKLEHDFGIDLPALEDFDLAAVQKVLEGTEQMARSRAKWRLLPQIVLSRFSFAKEVIFRDLQSNEVLVMEHPMIEALALGAESDKVFDFEPLDEERIDEIVPPESSAMVLDADASQRRCVAAASAGHSFVMDGPPGTGKSQTIVNIISELIGAGRTVLFVSDKSAALDVVKKRLAERGLDDFALELHSHKATRREVAAELGRVLHHRPQIAGTMSSDKVRELSRLRKELSGYSQAMNEVRPKFGQTLHEMIGRISCLSDSPVVSLPVASAALPEKFSTVKTSMKLLADFWEPVERRENFPWWGYSVTDFGEGARQRMAEFLEECSGALARVESASQMLASAFPKMDFSRTPSVASVLPILEKHPDLASLPPQFLTVSSFTEVETGFLDLVKMIDTIKVGKNVALSVAGPMAMSVNADRLSQFQRLHRLLRHEDVLFSFASSHDISSIRTTLDIVSRRAGLLEDIEACSAQLAADLRLDSQVKLVSEARALSEIVKRLRAFNRPLVEWLTTDGMIALREANRKLLPASREVAAIRTSVGEVFSDQVFELDVHNLHFRFSKIYRGFGRFCRAYLRDRRLVESAARSGKCGKCEINELGNLAKAAALNERLKVLEASYAGILGRYYKGLETDFDALSEAAATAEFVYEQMSSLTAASGKAFHFLGGDALSSSVLSNAQKLESLLQQLEGLGLPDLPGFDHLVRQNELRRELDFCKCVGSALVRYIEVVDSITDALDKPLSQEAMLNYCGIRFDIDASEKRLWEKARTLGLMLDVSPEWILSNSQNILEFLPKAASVRQIAGGPVYLGPQQAVEKALSRVAEVRTAVSRWSQVKEELVRGFDVEPRDRIANALSDAFSAARVQIEILQASVADLVLWADFKKQVQDLSGAGLEVSVQSCISSRIPRSQVARSLERAVLTAWVEKIISSDDRLSMFRAPERDNNVKEFRDLDRKVVGTAAGRVVDACNRRKPRTLGGAVSLIDQEANKKKRHMPTRLLFQQAGTVIQALKPCFMMSPMTVSQFLPPDIRFDTVVFDEASQVQPAESLCCIYRGRQLIVAGDQKQLPPTNFFNKSSGDTGEEWDEEQLDDFESLLDLCKAKANMRSLPLNWHYRSRHEDLISFSNISFYNGRLTTFPGANQVGEDIGLELYRVNGRYRRATTRDNPEEARKVVERVLFHVTNQPKRSLGVVTFSQAQADLIEGLLDQEKFRHPALMAMSTDDRLDGLFVKPLELVQGDERDTMIFSVGYGPDENGKFTQQLGPLTRAGGERRLNVAVTRAKHRIELVSSIDSSQLVGAEEKTGTGLFYLKKYLEFAEMKGNRIRVLTGGNEGSQGDVESPFEDEVRRVIRSWGYNVVPQIGCAGYRVDLGVEMPGKLGTYVLGVECDGASYHSAKAARDRDRLRQSVLEGLGWRLYRIWSTSWFRSRLDQESALKKAIEDAIASYSLGQTRVVARSECGIESENDSFEATEGVADDDELVESDVDEEAGDSASGLQKEYQRFDFEHPPWTRTYEVSNPIGPAYGYEMHDPAVNGEIRKMIAHVVTIEGPVHEEIVLRRLRDAFGVGRAGNRIRDAFSSALDREMRYGGIIRVDGGFLLYPGRHLTHVRIPDDSAMDTKRNVSEVPWEEIEFAILNIVADVFEINETELIQRVARIFGWRRAGPDIQGILSQRILHLKSTGRLSAATSGELTTGVDA